MTRRWPRRRSVEDRLVAETVSGLRDRNDEDFRLAHRIMLEAIDLLRQQRCRALEKQGEGYAHSLIEGLVLQRLGFSQGQRHLRHAFSDDLETRTDMRLEIL